MHNASLTFHMIAQVVRCLNSREYRGKRCPVIVWRQLHDVGGNGGWGRNEHRVFFVNEVNESY